MVTSYESPWAESITELQSFIDKMPESINHVFQSHSKQATEAITSNDHLHVYQTYSDIDYLLQTAILIYQLHSLYTYVPQKNSLGRKVPAGAVIIADDFERCFEKVILLMKHITGEDGEAHCKGNILVFDTIAIVRGTDPTMLPGPDGMYSQEETHENAMAAMHRVVTSIENVSKITGKKYIVWHHGPYIHFLNFFFKTVRPAMRQRFVAITVMAAVKSNDEGVSHRISQSINTTDCWERLYRYGTAMRIPVVLLDNSAQMIEAPHLTRTFPRFGDAFIMLFPYDIWYPHVASQMDVICMYMFRLAAAIAGKSGVDCVERIKSSLNQGLAKQWARGSINPIYFSPEACEMQNCLWSMKRIRWLVDLPIRQKAEALDPMCRVEVGPGRPTNDIESVRVELDFANKTASISSSSPLYLLKARHLNRDEASLRLQGFFQEYVVRCINSPPDGGNRLGEIMPIKIAEAWMDLRKVCLGLFGEIFGSGGTHVWTEENWDDVKIVKELFLNGSMTQACRYALSC
ncbi:hypothetical protein AOQ84DRAFT_437783 [Glonium stellatum]|uniref:Uncharacterized protein n=1 Tax=Glonium stellatum TaxID=574774 RepID=A0A8E2F6Q8_9PEZI|nr:hypothetical protein AOQ84DRAFT_437783 [Glonium stellatum]